uniref:Calcineurin-like phosphoesterase domain-containing protein n=1 Tax=Grammatophora oceanica TaxID=210454 RepID=A0A7S1YB14_9STRA|mmetsp:Transcript_37127/g.55317  ORF Transcript_37127/g.55317 Transcript_37127/m.55317 type:complete len:777 (+) Transcript_37127:109-2439(+)|eukprot:CAMPEP_0194041010 /NCGR_PEP_ID=MMETSP0009_2-20130614/12920_1 /TAXON_ID=210454 /ORGANISM="Grammatophora oceanica, Strain CCMP 410" /LENGTH=776 /DNA_ID=CAMNT_0038684333 /DNA_START=108 /DNA_END=2438 /DNA_ORIENTATION=-
MDEDYDELMGPPMGTQLKRLVPEEDEAIPAPVVAVTPENNTESRRSSASRSAPPMGAFAKSNSSLSSTSAGGSSASGPPMGAFSNRWSKYEEDESKLQREAAKATGQAIASAATRAAERADAFSSQYSDTGVEHEVDDFMVQSVQDRLTRGSSSLPHEEEVKNFAASNPPPSSPHKPRKWSFNATGRKYRSTEEETIEYSGANDRVRAEALRVLEMADQGTSERTMGTNSLSNLRRTRTGGYTSDRLDPAMRSRSARGSPQRAGFNDASSPKPAYSFKKSSSLTSASSYDRAGRFSIDSDDDELEVDDTGFDVVSMQSRSALGRAVPMASHTSASTPETSNDESTPRSSWSSRYSTPAPFVTTGLTTSRYSNHSQMLDDMDRHEAQRLAKSAQNMYTSSPHKLRKSSTPPRVFGANFSFTGKQLFSQDRADAAVPPDQRNLRTVWMDVDLKRDASPPQPDGIMYHRGPDSFEKRRRRRNYFMGAFICTVLAILLGAIFGGNKLADGDATSNSHNAFTKGFKFAITSNCPYDTREEKKLASDLAALEDNVQFLVHLGNVHDAAVTLCPETSYLDAAQILSTSTTPVFILPGPHDWNDCPSPVIAFNDWTDYLSRIDKKWDHGFKTGRQINMEENFFMLEGGTLFLGLHIVGGRVDDKIAWAIRHEHNVKWVQEQFDIQDKNAYNAVVLMGNSKPSRQQHDFWDTVGPEIKKLGKPTLYIHAASGDGVEADMYKPFDDVDNLVALEIEDGGKSPPMTVTVSSAGSSPFHIGRHGTSSF